VPFEILDQIGQQRVSSLSGAVLAARAAELRERLVKTPSDRYVMHELGTVLYHQGASREAMALWGSASKQEPNLAPADLMLAVQEIFSLLARGDGATAQIKLAAAEKRFAKQPHFHLVRAEQAMRSQNPVEAERALKTAQSLAPQLYVTALSIARFYEYAKRDPVVVLRQYESAAALAPGRPEGWFHLGSFQFRQRQIDAALGSLRKARSASPGVPLPERRLGELAAEMGDQEGAGRWYRAALAAKPSSMEELEIRAALGETLLRLGRQDEARTEIETVLKTQESPPLIFALATIDEAEGKFDAAERRYRRALELSPGNPLASNNLAMLLIKNGTAGNEAMKLAEHANRAIPNHPVIQGTYACALQQAGRNKDAIRLLEPVVTMTPKEPWARYCLGKALAAEKRAVDARGHLAQLLVLAPAFARRAEVEKLLATLR